MSSDENSQLTDKQQAFVNAYLSNGFNATRAAKAAGYKGSNKSLAVIGSDNLRKPNIAAEIKEHMAALAMEADEVLARLTEHGRGDMRDFIGSSPAQLRRHPKGFLIKKLKRKLISHKDGSTEEIIELELYDAQGALGLLGKHYRLFVERTEFSGTLDIPKLRIDDMASILRLIREHKESQGDAGA